VLGGAVNHLGVIVIVREAKLWNTGRRGEAEMEDRIGR
jgi:hypothetical protein